MGGTEHHHPPKKPQTRSDTLSGETSPKCHISFNIIWYTLNSNSGMFVLQT